MNRAKLKFGFVLICITLSFFSVCFAAGDNINSTYLTIDGHGGNDVSQDPNIDVIQSENNGKLTQVLARFGDSNFYMTPNISGLYAINVTTMEWSGRVIGNLPWKYYVGVENGSQVDYLRIPAVKSTNASGNDSYTLYCKNTSPNKGSTSVVVWLEAGQKYVLHFEGGGVRSVAAMVNYLEDGTTINGVKVDYANTYLSGFSTYSRTMQQSSGATSGNTTTGGASIPLIPTGANVRTPDDKPVTGIEALKSQKQFEIQITALLIAIGDFGVRLIDQILGEKVTITGLIFNDVRATNANFFDPQARASGIGGANIHVVINEWFQFFKTFAIACYLICLLMIGVQILLNSTAAGMTKARELFSEWLKGILILFLVHYAMRWIFAINESLVELMRQNSAVRTSQVGTSFSSSAEWSAEDIEFRSPQYISKYTGKTTFGSAESNEAYMGKLTEYKQNLDLMRIMRAYAGATGSLGYTLIWYILIGQLIVFIFLYYKRYFMIAFLIAVFPVTCIFNAISIMQGKRGPQMATWFKEFITNVFTQFFHAVIYTIITGVVVGIVNNQLTTNQTSGSFNWLIIIVSINFVPEGEKILKKIFSALGGGSSGSDLKGSAGGMKGMVHSVTSNFKNIARGFKG